MANETNKAREDRVARRKSHQDKNLFSRMAAASAYSRSHAQKCLKQTAGLSIVEWRVLWDLSEAGCLSVQDLASIQRCDHSLISRALPQMKRKGYVDLFRDQSDKRQTVVDLTDAGRTAFELAAPIMRSRREKAKAVFSEKELALFLEYIGRLEGSLDDLPEPSQERLENT